MNNQKITTFNKEQLCSWLCQWVADYGFLNGSSNPEDYVAGPLVDDKGQLTGGYYVRTTVETPFPTMAEPKPEPAKLEAAAEAPKPEEKK
jgi:hypothetical protein